MVLARRSLGQGFRPNLPDSLRSLPAVVPTPTGVKLSGMGTQSASAAIAFRPAMVIFTRREHIGGTLVATTCQPTHHTARHRNGRTCRCRRHRHSRAMAFAARAGPRRWRSARARSRFAETAWQCCGICAGPQRLQNTGRRHCHSGNRNCPDVSGNSRSSRSRSTLDGLSPRLAQAALIRR